MPVRPHRCPPITPVFLLCFAILSEACSKASQPAPQSTPTTSTAAAAAVPPAPTATPRVRTQFDFDRERLPWLRRHSIPPAQKASGQDLPLDPNLAQFLERACLFQCRQEGAPAADALEAEGRSLYETGYDNPVFLRAYGQVLAACGKTTESSDVETQALMKFPEPVASPINVFMASAQLAAAMRAAHGPFYPAALAVQRAALRKLSAAIAEGAFTPAESPIAWRLLADNVAAAGLASPWKDAMEGLKGAKVDPWLAGMIRGMAELGAARAWIATGGSAAANKLEIERTTHDHITAARAALTEALRLNPERTEAAAVLAEVGKVASDEWRVASEEGPGVNQVAGSQLPVASNNQPTTGGGQLATNVQITTGNGQP
jgi:hypothetical protein